MALRFTFRQLEYLVAVGDEGTIAMASQQLNVSSPSISTAINQLEGHLGIQLFVRHHAQGLCLTPGGRRVYNEAKRILADAVALNDLANEINNLPRGSISIGALSTIAPVVSARMRRSFEQAYPDARVTLHMGDQVELFRMLGRAEIDVAITYDMQLPTDIHFQPLTSLAPKVMLPMDHPMAVCPAVSLKALENEPMVLLDLPLSRDYFLSTFQMANVRPDIAERAGDIALVRSLVANGFGYSLLNIGTENKRSPDGFELAILPVLEEVKPVTLGLATFQTDKKSAIVAAFFDHVAGQISAIEL
ncbi:MAG: LysR substrate-binding domain-containing protein [Paracoccaceae bacterium]|nr:LysR substrate-binding domain-containing protein [Paracoccaceae bacterium]